MSSSINKVFLIGNLTADPEIRETPSGHKVATFSVATEKKWKDAGGEVQKKVTYHSCVAWRKLAEIIEQYVVKGMKVHIEGSLDTRSWDHEDGTKRWKTDIIVDEFMMLSSRDRATKKDEESNTESKSDKAPAKRELKSDPDQEIAIEDIPF